MRKINLIEAGITQYPQHVKEGHGWEAAIFRETVYTGGSHYSALVMVANELGLDVWNDVGAYNAFYARLWEGGDLYKQIKHAWFNEQWWYVSWNYYFGE